MPTTMGRALRQAWRGHSGALRGAGPETPHRAPHALRGTLLLQGCVGPSSATRTPPALRLRSQDGRLPENSQIHHRLFKRGEGAEKYSTRQNNRECRRCGLGMDRSGGRTGCIIHVPVPCCLTTHAKHCVHALLVPRLPHQRDGHRGENTWDDGGRLRNAKQRTHARSCWAQTSVPGLAPL